MHFLIILAVLIAFASEELGVESAVPDPAPRAAAVLAGILFVTLTALALGRLTTRRLLAHPDRQRSVLRRYRAARLLHMAVLMGVFALTVHVLDWNLVVRRNWRLADAVLLDELLVLAPFVASLVLSWTCVYDVDRAVREQSAAKTRQYRDNAIRPGNPPAESPSRREPADSPHDELSAAPQRPRSAALEAAAGLSAIGDHARAYGPEIWSRARYVEYQVRHCLGLVLAPVVILFTAQDVLRLFWPEPIEDSVLALWALAFLFLSVVLLFPFVLKFLWKARSLEPGPLRDRLEAAARRCGFRARDLLVWETYGGVANAAVAGFIPQARFVMLSDGLLRHMTGEEIEAVFGHEVGHVRHRHLLLRLWCMAALIGLAIATGELLAAVLPAISAPADWLSLSHGSDYGLLIAGLAASYIAVGFGFFSRRLERQADVFGCRFHSAGRHAHSGTPHPSGTGVPPVSPIPHPSGTGVPPVSPTPPPGAIAPASVATFIDALQKLAALNGIDPRAPSWQHFSIARRVNFLLRVVEDPTHALRLERSVRLLTILLALVSAAGIAWVLAL